MAIRTGITLGGPGSDLKMGWVNMPGINLKGPRSDLKNGWVNMQEWWVSLKKNGGSTWSGIYIKKPTDEIWEFRTLFKRTQYRLFAFWDKSEKIDTVVIATHGLIKKTNKTPQGDLDKAERLRKKYFELKNKKK